MDFPTPLLRGRLIQRYKRFLSDIELDTGEIITAHCANSGSMLGLKEPGSEVWVSRADNPKRKLKYTWELVDPGTSLVGINTSLPNKIVADAIADHKIPQLDGYPTHRREVKYGANSRIDILLSGDNKPDCYVEVKSVTLKREGELAEFPDSVTARGTKHLNELVNMVRAGHRAVMFYLVQRNDCSTFNIASDIDPAYAEAFSYAKLSGVEFYCYQCQVTSTQIKVGTMIQIVE
ncbi:MAG: DNA/RNA nuclease SfsA [Sneathiella sp.]